MAYLIPERSYLIPEDNMDLNEIVRRMNAERMAEWQRWHDTLSKCDDQPENRIKTEEPQPEKPDLEQKVKYVLMPQADTYALGVQALRDICLETRNPDHPLFAGAVVRPLTFRENILARVEDYERVVGSDGKNRTNKDRLRLFNTRLDSCTGNLNKAKTTKFKIIIKDPSLVNINKDFNKSYLSIDYSYSLPGIELDSSVGNYNQQLPKNKVLNNPGWMAVLEEDKNLLQTYSDIIFKELKQDNAMGFYVRQNTDNDELRALFVSDLNYSSFANGNYGLDNIGSFLLVAPS